MSALLYLAPEFIKENRLCWLRSPLYIVKKGKKEYYYYSDEEYSKAHISGEVNRAKGLGALSPEQAHNSMFTEEFQRMDVLKPNEGDFEYLLDLMGDDVGPRKEFVMKNVDFREVRE